MIFTSIFCLVKKPKYNKFMYDRSLKKTESKLIVITVNKYCQMIANAITVLFAT